MLQHNKDQSRFSISRRQKVQWKQTAYNSRLCRSFVNSTMSNINGYAFIRSRKIKDNRKTFISRRVYISCSPTRTDICQRSGYLFRVDSHHKQMVKRSSLSGQKQTAQSKEFLETCSPSLDRQIGFNTFISGEKKNSYIIMSSSVFLVKMLYC